VHSSPSCLAVGGTPPVYRVHLRRAVLCVALASSLLGSALVLPPRPAAAAPAAPASVAAGVIAHARSLLGAPYAHVGDDPRTGFSCIGLVHYLYARAGIDVPYELNAAYAAHPHVDPASLEPGDLIFFSNTVWAGLSHVALYIGGGAIIGADNFKTGVELTTLSDPYWLSHYTGATRPLAVLPGGLTSFGTSSPLPGLNVAGGERLKSSRAGGVVYSGPDYSYPAIDRLSKGMALRVMHTQGVWTDVSYHGGAGDFAGWVDGRYLVGCTIVSKPAQRRHKTLLGGSSNDGGEQSKGWVSP